MAVAPISKSLTQQSSKACILINQVFNKWSLFAQNCFNRKSSQDRQKEQNPIQSKRRQFINHLRVILFCGYIYANIKIILLMKE